MGERGDAHLAVVGVLAAGGAVLAALGAAAATVDFGDLALLITALGTFIATITTSTIMLRNQMRADRAESQREHFHTADRVEAVATEVATSNALKMGAGADAAETRRIEDIPHDERTASEQHHLDESPPKDPPQGPGR